MSLVDNKVVYSILRIGDPMKHYIPTLYKLGILLLVAFSYIGLQTP